MGLVIAPGLKRICNIPRRTCPDWRRPAVSRLSVEHTRFTCLFGDNRDSSFPKPNMPLELTGFSKRLVFSRIPRPARSVGSRMPVVRGPIAYCSAVVFGWLNLTVHTRYGWSHPFMPLTG